MISTVVLAGVILAGAQQPPGPPPEWRRPLASEVSDGWRDESSHRYLSVIADFDADTQDDLAGLYVSTTTGEAALVAVLFSQPGKPFILERFDDASWLGVMGVELVAAGVYATACGKGYWECEPGEPPSLTLTVPAIDLFRSESANSFFFYDANAGVFQRVWISD